MNEWVGGLVGGWVGWSVVRSFGHGQTMQIGLGSVGRWAGEWVGGSDGRWMGGSMGR